MGPYPRYLLDRCCDNTKHITYLDDNDYISYLIGSCKDTTRTLLHDWCQEDTDPEPTNHDDWGRGEYR